MKIIIEVPDQDWVRLTGEAYKIGFKRERPNKAWSEKEKKEAIRFLINGLLIDQHAEDV